MTREEQINQELNTRYETPHFNAGFVEGAHWADTHPHWISVEDELPEWLPEFIGYKPLYGYSEDVLVYLKDGSITVGRREMDNSTGEQYWLLDIEKELIVTHWMPLPAPPKEETK